MGERRRWWSGISVERIHAALSSGENLFWQGTQPQPTTTGTLACSTWAYPEGIHHRGHRGHRAQKRKGSDRGASCLSLRPKPSLSVSALLDSGFCRTGREDTFIESSQPAKKNQQRRQDPNFPPSGSVSSVSSVVSPSASATLLVSLGWRVCEGRAWRPPPLPRPVRGLHGARACARALGSSRLPRPRMLSDCLPGLP
jgi:hypothetical protein